jgi:hypothetical protein
MLSRFKRYHAHAISFVIIAILALQAIALFKPIRRAAWPFVNYPMYATPHYEGDNLSVEVLVFADFADGTSAEIRPGDVGLNWFKFFYQARCIAGLHGSCSQPELYARQLAELYEERTNKRIVRMTAKSYPAVLTRNGMQPAESVVLGTVQLANATDSSL